jgi:hypothetical protein
MDFFDNLLDDVVMVVKRQIVITQDLADVKAP